MNIVVPCPCGTNYEFDVEPENGKMPVPVQCPTCGVDGTEAANALIAQASQPAPAPVAKTVQPPPAPGFKVPSLAPAQQSAPEPLPPPQPPRPSASDSAPVLSGLSLGLAGAIVGGFLAMLGWYLLIKTTGYEVGYAAWGVGVVTGLCARKLARVGSLALGLGAGACALVAILGGQYLAFNSQLQAYLDKSFVGAYDKRMEYAKEAVKVESDQDIRNLLVKYADPEDKLDATQITDQQIRNFRQKEMPELQQFTQGKPTRAEYDNALRRYARSFVNPLTILKESLSLFTLLWLFLGVGSAFKISSQ